MISMQFQFKEGVKPLNILKFRNSVRECMFSALKTTRQEGRD